ELARRAVRGGGEVLVPPATLAAVSDDDALAVTGEILQQMPSGGVFDERPGGHADGHALAPLACPQTPFAVPAATGLPDGMAGDIGERAEVAIGLDNDVTAVATVTTVGAAAGDVRLAAERQATVAAVAGLTVDDDAIHEHGGSVCQPRVARKPATSSASRFGLQRRWVRRNSDRRMPGRSLNWCALSHDGSVALKLPRLLSEFV